MGFAASNFALFGATVSTWFTPLWTVAVGAAVVLAVLFALAFLLRLAVPKVAAIAQTTAKEGISQPLFYVLLALVFLPW